MQKLGDKEYIKKCIEEKEKFNFRSFQILDLIEATEDPQYIEECIKEREKYGLRLAETLKLVVALRR